MCATDDTFGIVAYLTVPPLYRNIPMIITTPMINRGTSAPKTLPKIIAFEFGSDVEAVSGSVVFVGESIKVKRKHCVDASTLYVT